MKLTDAHKWVDETLSPNAYAADERRTLAHILLGEVFGVDRTHLLLFDKDTVLTPPQADMLGLLLSRMSSGMPVQYALGHCPFGGFDLEVSPAVLIPRPETEELCAWIIEREQKPSKSALRLLDVGCGSGCIAISLAAQLPEAEVYAFDASAQAVAVAERNAHKLIPRARLSIFCADLFDLASYASRLPSHLDLIVSNPPYIRPSEAADMAIHVLAHEPHTALFAPESDPLIFYRAICSLAADRLARGGRLYLEVNAALAEETQQLVSALLRDPNAELVDDLFGRKRFVCAVKDRNQDS